MRLAHSILPALLTLLFACSAPVARSAQAQTTDPVDPAISQNERICEIEISEVEAMRSDALGDLEPMQEAELERLMAEARDFCDDDNGVMAAIRLEAAKAIIEVARPPAPPGGEVLDENAAID